MEKEFIDELKEIIDANINEKKVKTVILMTVDSDGNANILTRGKLLDQAMMFSQLRTKKCIEKIEKTAFLLELMNTIKKPDDWEI